MRDPYERIVRSLSDELGAPFTVVAVENESSVLAAYSIHIDHPAIAGVVRSYLVDPDPELEVLHILSDPLIAALRLAPEGVERATVEQVLRRVHLEGADPEQVRQFVRTLRACGDVSGAVERWLHESFGSLGRSVRRPPDP